MKITPQDAALAFLETCKSLPESEHAAVADAVTDILRRHGLGKHVRTFPRLVRDLLEKREGIVAARLVTVTGDAGAAKEEILAALEHSLRKKVLLREDKDPSLLGGALLAVGDERFDASVRGALTHLRHQLTLSPAS
ncbi:MAG: F0F1 ATP synthase subunit delta [Candidatus Peribacteraceae bacterium]|nr:F0F1 ATP synthase subunit delta [Candidatus Peribacteraceae bacterium]